VDRRMSRPRVGVLDEDEADQPPQWSPQQVQAAVTEREAVARHRRGLGAVRNPVSARNRWPQLELPAVALGRPRRRLALGGGSS